MSDVHATEADSPPRAGAGKAQARAAASRRLPRLLKRAEFLAAAAGRRVHSSRMTVQIFQRPAPEGERPASAVAGIRGPRFGLTVTKKTANAVGRNRIRRRLRALLSELRPFWPEDDIDFVIVGRADMLTAKPGDIEADLKRAFSSPPRQGNPRPRNGQPSGRGRGKGHARPGKTAGQDPRPVQQDKSVQQDPTIRQDPKGGS